MSAAIARARRSLTQQGAVVTICWVGLVILALLAFIGPLTPLLDPYGTSTERILQPPSATHWLGTDAAGRDVLARVLVGARTSLLVGVGAITLLMTIATVIGTAAGYFGGITDAVLSRMIDALLSIPLLLLVTVFIALLKPGTLTVILVIGLLGWPATARLVRAETLTQRERSFVAASDLAGMSHRRIIWHHMLPNLSPILVVAATLGLAIAIMMESTISFLGLGIRPPTASLGSIVSLALDPTIFRTAPWVWAPGGIALAGLVIAVNLIGDGLGQVLDPSRQRRGTR